MAGSLRHITNDDGTFLHSLVENNGDRCEAMDECWDIIAALVGDDPEKLAQACAKAGVPAPIEPEADLPTSYTMLYEAHQVIAALVNGSKRKLVAACKAAGHLAPDKPPVLHEKNFRIERLSDLRLFGRPIIDVWTPRG